MNPAGDAPPPTVRAFLEDAVRRVAAADGRALLSFRDLILHPGLLTDEYMTGRGGRYINPLELFLLANLLFFVVGGLTRNHMMTTRLNSHLCCHVHSDMARHKFYRHVDELKRASWTDASRDPVTGKSLAGTGELWAQTPSSLAQYHVRYTLLLRSATTKFETRFDDASEQSARTLVIIFVPLLALLLAVLELRRGSGVQHIVFALHFYAFALTLYVVSWVVVSVITRPFGLKMPDQWWGIGLLVVQSTYLTLALGRAYHDGRVACVLKGAVAGYASIHFIQIYTLVLFMVAFYTA